VLILQGVASRFFETLGRRLNERGHKVVRVNFSAGDAWFWRLRGAINYRGGLANWPDRVEHLLRTEAVTDIMLFGDCRDIHRAPIELARKLGVTVHVFEEGYLRPDWITMEQGGVNGYSSLPRDPAWYLRLAATLPEWVDPERVAGGMKQRVIDDILWNTLTLFSAPFYGGYRTHRPFNPLVEYAGWLRRLLRLRKNRAHAERVLSGCVDRPGRAYVLALQLDSDYQIRVHSPYQGMADVMEEVIASFARKAPADTILVIKNHPLDNGLVNHRANARNLARRYDVDGRVRFIDGGHLPTLLDSARGLVIVNSTVGMSGLFHQCPTKTLGNPVYNMPGLTFQGNLDRFWNEGTRPDLALYQALVLCIRHLTQLNGSFYTPRGIDLGVEQALDRLEVMPLPVPAYGGTDHPAPVPTPLDP
jgi:capsular polysaccharide export protein